MVMVILMTKMMRFTGLRSWSLDTAMAMARVRRMKKMMRLTGLMKESIWRRSAERSHIKAYLTHTCRLCYAYTMYKHKHTGSHTHIHTRVVKAGFLKAVREAVA